MQTEPLIHQSKCRLVAFGAYRFDLDSYELWHRGEIVPLAPKPGCVLATLLSRQGDLVSRAELYEAGWGDTVVSVDLSLNTAIRQIRAVLDDSVEEPRFIQTVPRRGYRFIADVRPAIAGRGSERPRPWVATIGAALVFALCASVLAIGSDRPPTVSISTPRALDDGVDPATGKLLEESIRSRVARNGGDLTVLANDRYADRTVGDATYVVRSFLRTTGSDQTWLDVQVIRTVDRAILWSGRFDPHCDRVDDPATAIADYVARVLNRHAT